MSEHLIYRFDSFEVDTRLFELRKHGRAVALEPQVFGVLAYLVANHDRVVTKQELFDNVWQDAFVGEAALSTRLMEARKAIGDSGSEQRLIRTIRSRGYRFVGPIEARPGSAPVTDRSVTSTTRDAAPGQFTPVPPGSAPIGRSDELELLLDRFNRSSNGIRQTVFLSGQAGIGKTTLLDVFRRSVEPHALIVSGECAEHEGNREPYMPVLSGLARLGRSMEGGKVSTVLRRLAPTWLLQLPTLFKEAELEDLRFRSLGSTSERMLRQIDEALTELSGDQPVVVSIDDLHWADASTVALVQWLAQRRDTANLMVIGSFRAGFRSQQSPSIESVASSLKARGACELLQIEALSESCAIELIKDVLSVSEAPSEMAAVLTVRTDGNPLFMNAVLDDWMTAGMIEVGNGQCRLHATASELKESVPLTLGHLLENAVRGLSDDARRALEVASVAGFSFSAAEISAGTGWDSAMAESICESLVKAGSFLKRTGEERWADGSQSATYSFIHSLYRGVLYSDVTPARRAALHEQIADRLEMLTVGSRSKYVLKLADHYVRANEAEKAVEYLKVVAERAIERNAFAEAYESLSSALEFIGRTPESIHRMDAELSLLLMFSNVAVTLGGWSDAKVESSMLRAESLARELGDNKQLALVLYGLATMRELLGQYNASEELSKAQLEIVDSGLTLEARELLACSTFHQGKFFEALDHAEKGLAAYDPVKHHSPLMARYGENLGVSTNAWAALAHWFVGQADEALSRSDLALEQATDQVYSLTTAQIQKAFLHQFRLEPDKCIGWATATKDTAIEHGFPFRIVQADVLLHWSALELGHPEASIELLERAVEAYGNSGAALDSAYYAALVAEQYLKLGRCEDALVEIEGAFKRLGPAGTFFYEPELLRIKALAKYADDGNFSEAKQLLLEAVSLARRYRALPLELRAMVELAKFDANDKPDENVTRCIRTLIEHLKQADDSPDVSSAKSVLAGLA